MFQPGDRVRWESLGEDGFPIVRYGFVGGSNGDHTRVAVMLDDELKGTTVVDLTQLAPVTITNIELRLEGTDLLSEPSLRHGLVHLWTAEADQAGLEIRHVLPRHDVGPPEPGDGCVLAEIHAGGEQYILRADCDDNLAREAVRIHIDHPTSSRSRSTRPRALTIRLRRFAHVVRRHEPGHVVEDTDVVQFSPQAEHGLVLDHILHQVTNA